MHNASAGKKIRIWTSCHSGKQHMTVNSVNHEIFAANFKRQWCLFWLFFGIYYRAAISWVEFTLAFFVLFFHLVGPSATARWQQVAEGTSVCTWVSFFFFVSCAYSKLVQWRLDLVRARTWWWPPEHDSSTERYQLDNVNSFLWSLFIKHSDAWVVCLREKNKRAASSVV